MTPEQQKWEQSKAKLAGLLANAIAMKLMHWKAKATDPELKKFLAGTTEQTVRYLWSKHGRKIEKHAQELYRKATHAENGALKHDHIDHVVNSAEDAADDIWAAYDNR